MANKHWVSEWLEQTEELERQAVEAQTEAALQHVLERRALLTELSKLLTEFRRLEDKLWKTWK